MDKNLINEISRIHQVMGVEIINEIAAGGISGILKTVIKNFAEDEKSLIKSFIEGSLDSAGKSELINILKSEDGDALMTNLKTLINRSTVVAEKMLAQKELKLMEDLLKSGGKKIASQVEMTIKAAKNQLKSDKKFIEIMSKATNPSVASKSVETFLENGIRNGKSYSQMYTDAIKLIKKSPGVKEAIHQERIAMLKRGLDYLNILGWKGNLGVLAAVYAYSQDWISFQWVEDLFNKLYNKLPKKKTSTPETGGDSTLKPKPY